MFCGPDRQDQSRSRCMARVTGQAVGVFADAGRRGYEALAPERLFEELAVDYKDPVRVGRKLRAITRTRHQCSFPCATLYSRRARACCRATQDGKRPGAQSKLLQL